jgi:hypothetical protein
VCNREEGTLTWFVNEDEQLGAPFISENLKKVKSELRFVVSFFSEGQIVDIIDPP